MENFWNPPSFQPFLLCFPQLSTELCTRKCGKLREFCRHMWKMDLYTPVFHTMWISCVKDETFKYGEKDLDYASNSSHYQPLTSNGVPYDKVSVRSPTEFLMSRSAFDLVFSHNLPRVLPARCLTSTRTRRTKFVKTSLSANVSRAWERYSATGLTRYQ